ncbi:MAG: oligosaccharide flippase family protein [Treponema sp.]|nr:oligosaccharide flippase family protein [Treponema sp.]
MKIDRKKNAVSGTFWGGIQKIITIFFPFVVRTVFIKVLGANYLGLNGLFTSILSVLNLAELGVSSALVFSMYKPIADDDEEKICALMKLYKICYRVIGCVILFIGICIAPFISILIHSDLPEDINIYIIYFMNLGATVLSYWLFAYRNSLFNAHQRTDILSIISSIVYIFSYSIQICVLLFFKNYYLYLLINIICQVLINITTAIVSKKKYPSYIPEGNISKEEKKQIFKKVRDLFTAKIGGVINNSADSIVVSSFLGLNILGIYQNYYFIVSIIISFFLLFYNACNAGIANSLILNKESDNKSLLYNINYIVFFCLNFSCVSLLCLMQPFIKVWVGSDYMLPFGLVILFIIYLYAEIAPRTFLVFKDAAGLWKEDRFRPLTVSLINLCLNLLTVKRFGLYGVILSTVVAMLLIGFPWLLNNINKYLIRIDIKKYLSLMFAYTVTIAINCFLTFKICSFIVLNNLFLELLLKGLVCLFMPNLIFILVFFKTNENKYLLNTLKGFVKKIKKEK